MTFVNGHFVTFRSLRGKHMNAKDIFSRLLDTTGSKTMTGLSELLGYQINWATTMKKRNSIPFEACAKVSEEYGVTIDFLLTGKKVDKAYIDKNDLKVAITEGLFTTIQTELISLNEGAKISTVANAICDEVVESLNIEHQDSSTKAG